MGKRMQHDVLRIVMIHAHMELADASDLADHALHLATPRSRAPSSGLVGIAETI